VRALVVTNMYPTPTAPATGTFVAARVESLRDAGVQVELLHLMRHEGGRRVYRGLAKRVKDLVVASKPNLVHVMYGGVMAHVVTRAIRELPVVVSFCGSDLLGGKANGAVGDLALRYGVLASRRAARRAAGVLVMSHNLFDALPRSVDRSRVWIVPDGVDFSRFRPKDRSECQRALRWDPGRRHVLFPALPSRPVKRFSLAEAAVTLLNRASGGVELHALDGVPHGEVPVWLNAAGAIVLTSIHEGSPNVVKEALACNVPVVSVDVGDVRERIAGIAGCFIADPTPEDLSAKLGRALERERPTDARDRIADLSLERVAEQVRDIYRLVTADANGRPDRPDAR
jgi:teichuronic acid biosynthesis glycosyltransferase TuaC